MPGPDLRECTPYLGAGPGGLPLALRLSEGLGRTVDGSNHCARCSVEDERKEYGESATLSDPGQGDLVFGESDQWLSVPLENY